MRPVSRFHCFWIPLQFISSIYAFFPHRALRATSAQQEGVSRLRFHKSGSMVSARMDHIYMNNVALNAKLGSFCKSSVCAGILACRAEYIDSVYTLRYNSTVADGIEFDWDAENTKHLAAHKVTAWEFESVMRNSPLDLAYEVVDGEERYRSVGVTDSGRLLVAILDAT